MVDYIDPATGERTSRTRGVVPGPGSRFVPANKAGMYVQSPPQGPGGGMGGLAPQQLGRLIQLPGGDMDELVKRDIYNDLMKRQRQLYPPGSTMPTDPSIGMPEMGAILSDDEINKRMESLRMLNENARIQEFRKIPPPTIANQQGVFQVPAQQFTTASAAIGNQFSQPIPQAQQMQNYQNFLQQGMQNSNTLNQGATGNFANMQPGMQATQTASTAPRKFSITSNPQVKAF
jgi:hypothetical protein